MLVKLFFLWWYKSGWVEQTQALPVSVKGISDVFSVKILLRTMFSPWKQISYQSFSDTALDDKFRVMLDNLFSRTIGFFIRLLTLFVAMISVVVVGLYRLSIVVVWPFLPIMPLILLALSVVRLVS